ncbi:MAG: alpha/beta hydrolase family protein, partial [Planctomycetaceae bacterium]
GPDQSDETKFGTFADDAAAGMWTTHAIAAVLRGHSLLAAQPGVDADRIGITGISWGGYLTCIAAGVDDRLRVAVPVYGCGFLHENSVWREPRFDRMEPTQRDRWVKWFDPSQYLPHVRCPILFLNGTNDFAYPLDSYRRSYDLVPGQKTVAVIPRLPHGHIWTFREVDFFVDSILKEGQPLPLLGDLRTTGREVSATVNLAPAALKDAALHYTVDAGAWQKREWKSLPAIIAPAGERAVIRATLPADAKLVYYLAVKDSRDATVSTRHSELP